MTRPPSSRKPTPRANPPRGAPDLPEVDPAAAGGSLRQYSGHPTSNQQALDVFALAFAGSQLAPVDATSIVGAAGVLHCIAMHVPDPGFLFWDHFETGTVESWAAVEP